MTDAGKNEKTQIRKDMRTLRRALEPAQKREWDRQVATAILNHPWYLGARTIMAYLALPDEIDLGGLIAAAGAMGKQVCVPRVRRRERLMEACLLTARTELVAGSFGIVEPAAGEPVFPLELVDLVIMPGLAFTPAGDRIGYGGGYYDRFLGARGVGTRLLGVAYDWQVVPDLPTDSLDQKIHGLVTPSQVIWIGH